MQKIKDDMKLIQSMTFEAYKTTGSVLARLENPGSSEAISRALDKLCAQFERSAVALRNLCEINRPNDAAETGKPALPDISVAGSVSVNSYGWLHIELNTLLPHCRFQTPAYLIDTLMRLLDEYESRGQTLPRFSEAMLIIDEHCDVKSRRVYDQDNKGWKAIPNALKGRVIKDDDQFTLSVALVSTMSDAPACPIYLIPQSDAGDFFLMQNDGYGRLWDEPSVTQRHNPSK